MKNECGKTRKVNEPYEVYRNSSGWEWRVLKKYQSPDKESGNQTARWFVAAKSPATFGGYDLGDEYVVNIKANGYKVMAPVLEKW